MHKIALRLPTTRRQISSMHRPSAFWAYFGRRTIELASLRIGWQVLDVCCGTGASALPTAEAVGPTGNVIGVDLAKELLELARRTAVQQRLGLPELELAYT